MPDFGIIPGGGSGSGGGGGSSNASVGPTGITAPAFATEVGFISGGNLLGVSATNPLPVTGGGGGTQYTDGTAESATAFTITVAGLYNGTDVVGLRGDASDNLYVNVHTALPAGTNIIGKFGIDQTTPGTTNGVQINAALPAGANLIGQIEVSDGANVLFTSGHPGYVQGTITVQQASAGSLNATVVGTGTFAVQAAQTGTWNIGTVTAVTAITNALPAGTNVIGHVITDSGSTTAVTGTVTVSGTVAATQSGAWNINQTLGTPGYAAITDGTTGPAAVKAASTAAVATDKALVVAISPNNTVPVSGTTNPAVSGTLTDRSGTITTGGTSQQLAAVNAGRKYVIIQNPSTATESLFINFTTAASTTAGNSIELVPGGSYERTLATYMTTEAININAATTAHAFTAKEG